MHHGHCTKAHLICWSSCLDSTLCLWIFKLMAAKMQQARRTYWICWCAARCCQSYLQVGATSSPNTWRQGFNCHLGLYLVQVTSLWNMWGMTVQMIHNLVSFRTLQLRVPLGKVHVSQMVSFFPFCLAWIWTWLSWLGFFQQMRSGILATIRKKNSEHPCVCCEFWKSKLPVL